MWAANANALSGGSNTITHEIPYRISNRISWAKRESNRNASAQATPHLYVLG